MLPTSTLAQQGCSEYIAGTNATSAPATMNWRTGVGTTTLATSKESAGRGGCAISLYAFDIRGIGNIVVTLERVGFLGLEGWQATIAAPPPASVSSMGN